MVWLVGVLLLLWMAWGPVVLVAAAATLCVPRVRWWVQDRTFLDRRTTAWVTGAVVVLGGVVVAVPDGRLPVPPAPGAWAGPSYVGRPAMPRPVVAETPSHPHRAAGSPLQRPGPLGLQPEVETAWLGLERCGRLEVASTDALVALCSTRSGSNLRLVDPETLRPTGTRELPARSDGSACGEDAFYLDAADRAVVATADRRVLAVPTRTEEGEPGLGEPTTWDLRPYVPDRDCLVALAPDWSGRLWWVSRRGLVGTIAADTGRVAVTDLGEEVRRDIAVDEAGGVYVVTDAALHRLAAGPDGTPQPVWRTAYDGSSGSAPVPVGAAGPGGAVAITDTAEDRLGVLFLARDDGRTLCRQPVFEEGGGATDSTLAPLASGVVVANNHGWSSPRSTLLGFTGSPGLARVDLAADGCALRWTSDAVSPSSGATASWPTGLLYAWTKRPSLAGVSAWYLTAVDAESGRSMWSVRTGTGLLAGSNGSEVLVGSEGSAWLGTMAGLVRVRDRR
ncbi:hypothetical protein [Nocardioides renjunii]|uniref:hypothetical protein n=1 Tax=Nocardioides renjunii TaxID=3095075 RepID=UPI002AFFE655|nr:hypothetical protein [Nocardioides sp. S-34]WQQ22087.1 hypothetical protein SHK17_19640 [Nocardioides sp. S-34]